MIKIDGQLGIQVRKKLNVLKDKYDLVTDTIYNVSPDTTFSEEELDYIVDLSISKNDIKYLSYFKNIQFLEVTLYPSIDDNDFIYITNHLKQLKGLSIANQDALTKIDLNNLIELEDIVIINNDNLKRLINIQNCKDIKRISIFNNRSLDEFNSVFEYIYRNEIFDLVELDITYFDESIIYLKKLGAENDKFAKIEWIEAVGTRTKTMTKYTNKEMTDLYRVVSDCINKYIFSGDGDIEKFFISYVWFINNIKFLNSEVDIKDDNVSKVLTLGYGSRVTFAKAFQFLLSVVGIDSDMVYSIGALDTIGYNNGVQVYNLNGSTDYGLLRIKLDGRHYYCDIAWDSMIINEPFYESLRLILVSLDELKIRHQLVGNFNENKSTSYSRRDTEESLIFANDRINDVDKIFNEIDQFNFNSGEADIELARINDEINNIKNEIDKTTLYSDEYNQLFEKLIDLEDKQIDYESNLGDYDEQKFDIINKYKDTFISNYIGYPNMEVLKSTDVSEIKNNLELLNKYSLISSKVYDILEFILKED